MNQTIKRSIRWIGTGAAVAAVAAGLYSFNEDKHNFEIVKSLDTFYSVFRELNTYYVNETEPEKLIKSGIDNMLRSLDPYTVFVPEEDIDALEQMITGEYGGIGLVITQTDSATCIARELYQGFPADKSGIRPGDRLVSIDGESIIGKSTEYISNRLRGTVGTRLTVQLTRQGSKKPIDKVLTRQTIQINPVSFYGMLDDETGLIMLDNFTQNCAEEVENAFVDLRDNRHATRIILDLRHNPGGLLDDAVRIVNLFVPRGSEILSTRGRIKQWDKRYKATAQPIDTVMPMAVIINRGSASSSEIVAGTLQDLDRAVIIGERSFGKGLVQQTRSLAYNSRLKMTTAKYYIPSGRCIQALDYSHRDENGAVGYVPDSLISEYKTKGGRTVYDGGGISPDIYVTPRQYGNITSALAAGDMMFRYAVEYASARPAIASPADFALTDADLAGFKAFVQRQADFRYTSATSESFERLKSVARKEGYYDAAHEQFEQLDSLLKLDVAKDMDMFADEIKEMLRIEILNIYYYQRGAIEGSLGTDPDLAQARATLADTRLYNGLLDGSIASHAGDKRRSNRVR